MTCAQRLLTQCNVWRTYIAVSVCVTLASIATGAYTGLTNWDLVAKVVIVLGTTTCVFWWFWVMKKMHDFAVWWATLKHNIDTAGQLLAEAKQDLKEIKHTL